MTKHIEKVREALEYMIGNEDSTPYWSQLAGRAMAALPAHEQEVAELVNALKTARNCLPQGTTADEVFDVIDAALRPFGDEK